MAPELTRQQRTLIRESFLRVRPNQDSAGELFYRRLFILAPTLAPLFGGTSIPTQASKLMHILAYVVDHLEQWSALTVTVEQLGARYVAYGVQPDHYAVVGARR